MSRLYALTLALILATALAFTATAHAAVFGDQAIKELQEVLASGKVSPQTQACIACHIKVTPQIVYEWAMSKHAHTVPADVAKLYEAMGVSEWADKIAPKFKDYKYVVGCYECHGMFHDQDRPDIIPNHNGYKIVTVVTLKDCSQCHPKEAAELSWTWHATGSLHAPFLPWYKAILAWAKAQGANPFGDAKARELYEKYFPPYLTKQRGKDLVTWDFYKEIAKAWFLYFNNGTTTKLLETLKKVTGMVTPYDLDFKTWLTPLWPSQPPANTTLLEKLDIKLTVTAMGQKTAVVYNVMSHPWYRNGYIYHACFECHGSIVIPYKIAKVKDPKTGMEAQIVKLWGWPNNGAARVDPDGSMGACTACHPRHMFSVKQARKPWTCGQCHLGYDHPHIEIFEESKHGNIENAYGGKWNWERIPWRVGIDFNAPTCATCHMSTLSIVGPDGKEKIVVKGTHDLVKRLVWDQMHFFSHPKPVIPDKPQVAMFLGGFSVLKGDMASVYEAAKKIPENSPYKYPVFMGFKIVEEYNPGEPGFPRLLKIEYYGELKEHREEMKKVCTLCHSKQWVDNYFRSADQNLIDYDIAAHFAFNLLKLAWKLGIHDNKNILDEYMEIMWYYIWHHDGRRWRNGATMMGPDFAHWYGVVDTIMDKLGRMVNYFYTRMLIRKLQTEVEALKKAAAGAPYAPELAAKIAKLEQEIQELKAKLAAMEAEVPALKDQLRSFEVSLEELRSSIEAQAKATGEVKASVEQLMEKLKELSEQLATVSPKAKKIEEMVAKIEKLVKDVETLSEKVKEASSKAGAALTKAEEAAKAAEEAKEATSGIATGFYTLAGIALAVAVIALGVAVVYARRG